MRRAAEGQGVGHHIERVDRRRGLGGDGTADFHIFSGVVDSKRGSSGHNGGSVVIGAISHRAEIASGRVVAGVFRAAEKETLVVRAAAIGWCVCGVGEDDLILRGGGIGGEGEVAAGSSRPCGERREGQGGILRGNTRRGDRATAHAEVERPHALSAARGLRHVEGAGSGEGQCRAVGAIEAAGGSIADGECAKSNRG